MTLTLNPPSPRSTFSWDNDDGMQSEPDSATTTGSPQTSWLPESDIKLFGTHPMSATSDIGVVRCPTCNKPLLRSVIADHAETCAARAAKQPASKPKPAAETQEKKSHKKRKASLEPEAAGPSKKKAKTSTKPIMRRTKGPINLDQQCGVINDKGLQCSRSLTCKSHAMGAKRAVEGRSKDYDTLLLEWQREHNPNFVEPVKKERGPSKKERKELERKEKQRLAAEAAAAGLPNPNTKKKAATATASAPKKSKKAQAAAAAAAAVVAKEDANENLEDLDSETEVDELVRSYRAARERGIIGVPLAVPGDAGIWFVQRRERARCCHDLLASALRGDAKNGMGIMGSAVRP
ncbi:SCA7, zinc-binding domain-containing protein [Schizophyllum commune]